MIPNSAAFAALMGSSSGAALTVKDQRFFAILGRANSGVSVNDQHFHAVFDSTISGLQVSGNGFHVPTGNFASVTTMDVPIPLAENGDTYFLHVMHRSALTTPAGWTLELTSGATASAAQQVSIFSRVRDGTEAATLTVEQAVAGRMLGQCCAVGGPINSVTYSSGVVNGGNSGSMVTGAVDVTKGAVIACGAPTSTTQYYNGSRGFAATYPFAQTLGHEVYAEMRLGVAFLPGLTGVVLPGGVPMKATYSDGSVYAVATDYVWTAIEIEAT